MFHIGLFVISGLYGCSFSQGVFACRNNNVTGIEPIKYFSRVAIPVSDNNRLLMRFRIDDRKDKCLVVLSDYSGVRNKQSIF